MGGGEDGRLFDFGAVFDLEQGQLEDLMTEWRAGTNVGESSRSST